MSQTLQKFPLALAVHVPESGGIPSPPEGAYVTPSFELAEVAIQNAPSTEQNIITSSRPWSAAEVSLSCTGIDAASQAGVTVVRIRVYARGRQTRVLVGQGVLVANTNQAVSGRVVAVKAHAFLFDVTCQVLSTTAKGSVANLSVVAQFSDRGADDNQDAAEGAVLVSSYAPDVPALPVAIPDTRLITFSAANLGGFAATLFLGLYDAANPLDAGAVPVVDWPIYNDAGVLLSGIGNSMPPPPLARASIVPLRGLRFGWSTTANIFSKLVPNNTSTCSLQALVR